MFETGISVPCGVTIGTFVSEYHVVIQSEGNVIWQGAVDKEMVLDVKIQPRASGDFVGARIYAYLISVDRDKAIIELPVEEGRRLRVATNSLREEKVPA